MPRPRVWLGLLFALSLAAPRAAAQDGPLTESLVPSHAALEAAARDRFVPSGPPCQDHFLDIQLMLGLENIVRVQAEVYHGERWTVLAEAQAGLEFVFVPSVGGGVRAAYRLFDDGQANAFFVAPGVDVQFAPAMHGFFHHPAWTVPEASVDFTWAHDCCAHFGTELGVQLGLLVVGNDNSTRWPVLPELSVYFGLRF
jgi:hypothetical protein